MTFNYQSGLGNASSYQVAAVPFISGAIDIDTESSSGTVPYKISFPFVTQWFTVNNHDTTNLNEIYVAFAENGLPSQGGTNYMRLIEAGLPGPPNSPPPLYWKVTEIWIEGTSTDVDIVAGLTGISTTQINNNWSGSAGVG